METEENGDCTVIRLTVKLLTPDALYPETDMEVTISREGCIISVCGFKGEIILTKEQQKFLSESLFD